MTDTGAHPSVFVCYARRPDGVLARELAVSLRLLGFVVRRDVDDLEPGDRWSERIDDLVRESAVFLALLSHDAIRSEQCQREWKLGEQEKKKILSIRTEDVEENQIPGLFASGQRIDYTGLHRSFADLVQVVADELRRDAAWFREQNYLAALGRDWQGQTGKEKPLYLLGKRQTQRAREALRARGARLPEPTLAVLEFIAASEAEHRRRQRMMRIGASLSVGLFMSIVGTLFFWSSVNERSEDVNAAAVAPRPFAPAASSPPGLPEAPTSSPAPTAAVIKELTQQFFTADRRSASDQLQAMYARSTTDAATRKEIVDATIEALQPKSRNSSYRVNLYVFVTLGRLPGWTGTPEQRQAVKQAAAMHEADPTYNQWAAKALLAANPPIQ